MTQLSFNKVRVGAEFPMPTFESYCDPSTPPPALVELLRSVAVRLPTVGHATKRIIAIGGISGCGKTTQILALSRFLGVPVCHVGQFVRTLSRSEEDVRKHEQQRAQGKLVSGVTEQFLDHVSGVAESTVLLDGFPRHWEQAVTLVDAAVSHGWHLAVIHLELDSHEQALESHRRQTERFRREQGAAPNTDATIRFEGKIRRYVSDERPAMLLLKEAGIPVCQLAVSGLSVEEVSQALFDAICEFPVGLAPDLSRLALVQSALRRVNIDECHVVSGAFCRTFWNGRFGPPAMPLDLDVVCHSAADAATLGKYLRETHSDLRWAITDLPGATQDKYGWPETDFLSARRLNPMLWRQGGIRVTADTLAIAATPSALYDLRCGILRLDEQVLLAVPEALRDAVFREAVFRARKAVAEYPRLTVVGVLSNHVPVLATPLAQPEYEQKGDFRWSVGLTEKEIKSAQTLRAVVRSLVPSISPIPIPAKVVLPEPLGTIQHRKDHGLLGNVSTVLPPPVGYETWMHYMSYEATDDQFREWLMMQSRSRQPIGGNDPFVAQVLSNNDLSAVTRQSSSVQEWPPGTQRSTHQGIGVGQHHLHAALCLSTTETMQIATEHGLTSRDISELRAGLRVGTFCHDIGKFAGPQVTLGAGFHENAGAALWNRHLRPSWASDGLSQTVIWCIRSHSLLGRLSRAIDEKSDGCNADVTATPSYCGAVDPAFVRSRLVQLRVPFDVALSACMALQHADLASIPALRYLLPIVAAAAKVVRAEVSAGDNVTSDIHDSN